MQFTYRNGWWVSDRGIMLQCATAFRHPLADNWTVWTGKHCWNSGITAEDALSHYLDTRGDR